jgi:hypothetical protein
MAQRIKSQVAGIIMNLKKGHDAMITVPSELVQMLLEISRKQQQ